MEPKKKKKKKKQQQQQQQQQRSVGASPFTDSAADFGEAMIASSDSTTVMPDDKVDDGLTVEVRFGVRAGRRDHYCRLL